MRLIILGAGGFGRVVEDLADQCGRYHDVRFLDDTKTGERILGRCADFLDLWNEKTEMYPAFGDNRLRLRWMERLREAGIRVPTLIHSKAYVSPSAVVEAGTVLLPMAVVNTDCQVGRGCILGCGAVVDHGCVLEDGVYLAAGAVVRSDNRIPRLTTLEANQVILPCSCR